MEFELPVENTDRHRPGPGWIALFGLVILLIVLQLVAYLDQSPIEGRDRAASNADRQLKMMVEYTSAISSLAGGNAPKSDYKELRTSLPKLEAKEAGPDSAVVAATIRRLLGEKPTQETLDKLKREKAESYRSFAVISEQEKPAEAEVRAVKDKLPKLFSADLGWGLALERAGVKDARKDVISKAKGSAFLVFILVFVLAFGLGVAAWIAYGVARASGKLQPIGHPALPIEAPDADRFASRAAQLLATFFLLPFAISVIAGGKLGKGAGVIFALVMIAVALLMMKLPVFGKVISLQRIGLQKQSFGKAYLWAMGALFAEIPVLLILAALSSPLQQFFPAPEHPITVRLAEQSDFWTLLSTFMAASLMAPIVEEITFRGLIAPAAAKLFRNTAVGLVIAAFMFAAIHPTGVPAWLPLAGFGFMSSLLAYQTGSLLPSMIFHCLHNTAILTLTVAVLG